MWKLFKPRPKDLRITFTVPGEIVEKIKNDRFSTDEKVTYDMVASDLMKFLSDEIINYFGIVPEQYERTK